MNIKMLYILLFFALTNILHAQVNSIRMYFLYGSKPAMCCKAKEGKYFGGLHGGHVSIGVGDSVIGFVPSGSFHIFGKRNNHHSSFTNESTTSFLDDTSGKKYTVITIPLTAEQLAKIDTIHKTYLTNTPYDYAFIGMRCAAATYDILAQAGIVKKRSHIDTMLGIFYPKILRKKLLKLAKKKGYPVHKQNGSTTRVWEKD